MKYSAGAVTSTGEVFGKSFFSKEEAEEYIITLMEKAELKRARIRDTETGEEEIII